MSIKVFWANSFFSGLVARELAGKCFLVDSERIFVGGLLAELGHLILYGQMPEQPEQALRESATVGTPIDAAEQNILGYDFTEIGQVLVEVWQLPKNLAWRFEFQIIPKRHGTMHLKPHS
jgi:HD-like signal output (HDOD) protein